MQAFEYASPATLREAVSLLGSQWEDAAVLAGGTDLISLMKDYIVTPRRVVHIRGIAELRRITPTPAGLRIGAAVSFEELLEHPAVAHLPGLRTALAGVSSPQIRAMGTVGGDLLQRPRCWYFRNGFGLLARDSSGRELVPAGDNRYHAILGNQGPAYFVCPSSLAPPLMVLGARVRLVGPRGSRELAVGELYRIPTAEGEREHTLAPNEILTEIIVPAATGLRTATYEVRERELLDWPLATASVAVRLAGGRIEQARIVLGHVAPIPWRAEAAEQWLRGRTLDEAAATQAGELAVQGARPLSRNGYKVQLARVAVRRALLAAREG
jgi:xanthine dehydrogenase YagS FAD-binding subunit